MKGNNINKIFFFITLIILISDCKSGSDTLIFDIKFSIVEKTCMVNNNKNITIDFGLINVPDIDGVKYERELIYTLNCDNNTIINNPTLKFQLSGGGASFNNDLLSTSEKNLAIRLKQNNINYPINSWVSFKYNNQPVIKFVPVKNGLGGINDGDFSASATFSVEYE